MQIPDNVLEIVGQNWDSSGYIPIFVFRLLERGFTPEQIQEGMTKLIGKDWLDVKASVWIDRIASKGNKAMIHSLEYDTPPVIDILTEELSKLVR